MKLTPVMEKYILHWGEMGTRWGVNRTVAQIHALLYLSESALNAEEITDTLKVARSNVSTSLKELESWGLLKTVPVMGDRREHFDTHQDPWDLFDLIIEGRKRRELDPTLTVLRECVLSCENDKETPQYAKDRMADVLGFMETLSGWYEQISQLPRKTLVKLISLGGKIQKLIGK